MAKNSFSDHASLSPDFLWHDPKVKQGESTLFSPFCRRFLKYKIKMVR